MTVPKRYKPATSLWITRKVPAKNNYHRIKKYRAKQQGAYVAYVGCYANFAGRGNPWILRHHGGVGSSKDLDDEGFKRVINCMKALGFWVERKLEQTVPRDPGNLPRQAN